MSSVLATFKLSLLAFSQQLRLFNSAFLQVRIQEADHDALRFHWIKDKDSSQIEVLQFTRALFGLIQSPFLLGGTLKQHLDGDI